MSPGPLNGPNSSATPPIPAPHWYWNDASQTAETVGCSLTVTPPAGQGSAFTVSPSQSVTVMLPDVKSTGIGGYMQVNNSAPNSSVYELWAGPTSDMLSGGMNCGMYWTLNVTTPTMPAFGLGQLEMVQIATLNADGKVDDNKSAGQDIPFGPATGLDGQCPYVSGSETAAGTPTTAQDSPGIKLIIPGGDQLYSASYTPSFTDYLLYEPPGKDSVFVPVGIMSWSTNGSATIPEPEDDWSYYSRIHGGDSAGTVDVPTGTFAVRNTFPSWTQIITVSH